MDNRDGRPQVKQAEMLLKAHDPVFVKYQSDMSGCGRVETGMLQFTGDWPGLFMRGDDAMGIAAALRELFEAAAGKRESILTHPVSSSIGLCRLAQLAERIRRQVLIGKKPVRRGYVRNHSFRGDGDWP